MTRFARWVLVTTMVCMLLLITGCVSQPTSIETTQKTIQQVIPATDRLPAVILFTSGEAVTTSNTTKAMAVKDSLGVSHMVDPFVYGKLIPGQRYNVKIMMWFKQPIIISAELVDSTNCKL